MKSLLNLCTFRTGWAKLEEQVAMGATEVMGGKR
jgi:hypothetical protein